MKLIDVRYNIGKFCTINGSGDFAIYHWVKIALNKSMIFKIIKITKGGMVFIGTLDDKEFHSVPCKNIDLLND